MPNEAPFEIIAAPFRVFVAPVGTTFPVTDLNDLSATDWVELSTRGKGKNITEDGVTISMPQTIEFFRGNGSTVPLKAFRTEEDVTVAFELADLSLEALSYVLDGNTVVDTAAGSGTAGYRSVSLYRGPFVARHALLVRGPSPYAALGWFQLEIYAAVLGGETEAQITKGDPGALAFEFTCVANPSAADPDDLDLIGYIRAYDAVALA